MENQSQLEKISQYTLGELLGEGSFGKVRVASLEDGNMQVAIKIMKSYEQAKREFEIGMMLHHPSIVKTYEFVISGSFACIVMERIFGNDLFAMIDEFSGGIPEATTRRILRHVADALAYAHAQNIVHLDLKPENILVTAEGGVKLIDWGLGAKVHSKQKLSNFVGSFYYTCPEVLRSLPYEGKSADVWSFGVVVYVCLTGLFPWPGSTNSQIRDSIVRGRYEWSSECNVSRGAKDLIGSCLKVNPSSRITMHSILKHPWFFV
jgi:serine/threonine protein kinase